MFRRGGNQWHCLALLDGRFLLLHGLQPPFVLVDETRVARDASPIPLFQFENRFLRISQIVQIESIADRQQARLQALRLEA